jgi:fatty acid desaturase
LSIIKQQNQTRYKRGYSPPRESRDFIAACHRTSLGRTTTAAVTDHLIAIAAVYIAAFTSIRLSLWVGAFLIAFALVITARQLRALECLVHEASHFNWSRSHRIANDALAALLAGAPTGAKIEDYRESHLLHHGKFGTNLDPDYTRYQELDIESILRSDPVQFALAVAGRLVKYQVGWLRSIGAQPLQVLFPIMWPVIFILIPIWVTSDGTIAVLATSIWVISYLFALPIIRFLGESSEHQFVDTDTVFDATITNIGYIQRLLIHPHNDGYHTLHHMWPGVPHFALARLHRHLSTGDPFCYAQRLRYRTRLLEPPRRDDERCLEPVQLSR